VLIDLVVAALAAGLPAASAVAAAREAASQDAAAAGVAHPLPVAAERAFLLAERTGASAAELLRRFAADERSARQAAVTAEAGRLGVRLVVPLGLTVLPAFVLLGVVPVVIGLARQLWVP
jgi:tight adherence protein B